MRPSPTLADTHRSAMERPASATARAATTSARLTISWVSCLAMPSLMISRNRSGLATVMTASMTTTTMKKMRIRV